VSVDTTVINRDLCDTWEVLAEAVQTVMRKNGIQNPYERMKELTRGRALTRDDLREFIEGLVLPEDDKKRLMELTPETYTGIAGDLIRHMKR
jgi:adenylosuccinate lyase